LPYLYYNSSGWHVEGIGEQRRSTLYPSVASVVKDFDFMSIVRLKIDVAGTVGDEAWREIKQFEQIQSADFGPQFGSGGRCNHAPGAPHAKGEWIGAEIRLQTPLLAQYAVSHYLEQERVLDADVVE
jgi:hypothetical protein